MRARTASDKSLLSAHLSIVAIISRVSLTGMVSP